MAKIILNFKRKKREKKKSNKKIIHFMLEGKIARKFL